MHSNESVSESYNTKAATTFCPVRIRNFYCLSILENYVSSLKSN